MKRFIFILTCLIILLCSIAGCTNKNNTDVDNSATRDSVEIGNIDVFLTDVGYCEIAYPKKWQDYVIVDRETENDVVKFSGRLGENEVPLFDIYFNDTNAANIGTITTDNGDVTVGFTMYEFDKKKNTDKYYDQYCAMCDDINVIIAKLHEMYNFKYMKN